MRKKGNGYVPGWLRMQAARDHQILENQRVVLNQYYAQQEQQRLLEEAQRRQELAEKEAQQRAAQEEVVRDTLPNFQLSPQEDITQRPVSSITGLTGSSYSTESALSYLERMSDPTAFWDQRVRTPLDPDYYEWMARQARREMLNDEYGVARAALGFEEAHQRKIEQARQKGKPIESVSQRLERRIWENHAFGGLNKNKELTKKEVDDIIAFKVVTDPDFALDYWNHVLPSDLQLAKEKAELEAVKEPEDYYGMDDINFWNPLRWLTPTAGLSNAQIAYKWLQSKHAESFLSKFILMSNESQMKASIGQIERSKELVDMSSKLQKHLDVIEQLAQVAEQLENYYGVPYEQLGNDEKKMYGALLDKKTQLEGILKRDDWYKNAKNLGSWEPGAFGTVLSGINYVFDLDLKGTRLCLSGLEGRVDDLHKLLNSNGAMDAEKVLSIMDKTATIRGQLYGFDEMSRDALETWKDKTLTDALDLLDWRTGNTAFGLKAKIDPYYKAQETLLEQSEFDWSDPAKMALFGWAGVAGGSNSSWWKSIISMSSKAIGAVGGAYFSGGTSVALQVGAIGTSVAADTAAGAEENDIEVEDRIQSRFRSALSQNEKYDKFIEEGLLQLQNQSSKDYQDAIKKYIGTLKDKQERDQFIMDMYFAGFWHTDDPQITKLHADAVLGANNQFYNDMPVNTADAVVDGVTTIANLQPVKYLAKGAKILGVKGIRALGLNKYTGKVALTYQGFKPGIHNFGVKFAEDASGKYLVKIPTGTYIGSTVGAYAGYNSDENGDFVDNTTNAAIGSVIGAVAGTGIHVGGRAAGMFFKNLPKYLGVEEKIAEGYQKVRAFGTRVPGAWMKAASIGKGAVDYGTRTAIETGEEMLQEGVLALNARDVVNADPEQYNVSMINRVFNDMVLGAQSAYIWLNQNDPEMKSESDVYSQMNATPLLTLFGPNTIQIVHGARQAMHDWKLISIVEHNIDAERRGNIAELEQGRQYAERITPQDKKEMREKFAQFDKIAGSHRDAIQKLHQGSEEDALMRADEHYIPSELIAEQKKDYEDIYTLAHSKLALGLAVANKIKPGSKKYAKFISMLNFRRKRRAEAFDRLHETDVEYNRALGQDLLEDYLMLDAYDNGEAYSEGEENSEINPATNRISRLNDIAKMLVHAATLILIVDDYSALLKLSGKLDVFLNNAKAKLNTIKETLKRYGHDVETIDDVANILNMSEEGGIIRSLVSRSQDVMSRIKALNQRRQVRNAYDQGYAYSEGEEEGSTENVDEMDMIDLLLAFMPMFREREFLEYDAIREDSFYSDFTKNPDYYLDLWDHRLQSDKNLEDILEANYVEAIRLQESASARVVENNDVYVGLDNEYYITEKKADGTVVKKKYDPKTRRISPEELKFDPIEYDLFKKDYEQNQEKYSLTKRINENMQRGTDQVVPETEEIVLETPTVDGDGNVLREFKEGDTVKFTEDDGTSVLGTIIGVNDDGTYDISRQYGATFRVHPDRIQKASMPINTSKYNQGDIITTASGKTYTVGKVLMSNVDEDTQQASYTYELVDADTGEVIKDQTDEDLDKLEEVSMPQVEESTVKPNKKQLDTIEALQNKREKDEVAVEFGTGKKRLTGHDYFIKLKNKIQRFIRVHGVLDDLFESDGVQKIGYKNQLKKLRELFADKAEFKKYVKEQQDKYNEELKKEFKEDSKEYEMYSLNLSYYLTDSMLKDEGITVAIATILSSERPGPAVIVGDFIDEIARLFFDPTEELVYDPKYRMSKATFNSIVNQLNALQKRFNKLGWIVDSREYTWYGLFQNGTKMAGTTDLIAIDKQGYIHVLDFKTTKDFSKFEVVHEYKTKDLDGNDVWVEYTPGEDDEEVGDAETRVSMPFIDQIATKDSGRIKGKRSYAAQYARQLEAYRLLIQQELGKKVKSLEIVPFAIDYDIHDGVATRINDAKVYDPINLSGVKELEQETSEIDNYLTSSGEIITDETINAHIEELSGRASDMTTLQSTEGVTPATKEKLVEMVVELLIALSELESLLSNKIKRADKTYVDQLEANADDLVQLAELLITLAQSEISYNEDKNTRRPKTPAPPITPTGNREWLNEGIEEVVPSEQQYWWHFNSLHSYANAVKEMLGSAISTAKNGAKEVRKYIIAAAQSDFIKNGTFVVQKSPKIKGDYFDIYVEYRGWKFGPITLSLGKNDGLEETTDRNKPIVEDRFLSTMARNFLRQYYDLAKDLKPGERIVATKVTRTNGVLHLSTKDHNLQNTQFFPKKDKNIWKNLINGAESLIGVSDGGIVVEVGSGNRETIWSPVYDESGENLKNAKHREYVVPGNVGAQSIPSGSVVFLYKFNYNEDPANADPRIVPIVLQGQKLDGKRGKTILHLLQQIAKSKTPKKESDSLVKVIATKKDGTKEETTVPGFTVEKMINLLVRFGELAEHAGHEFVFEYAKKANGKGIKGYNIFRITDMTSTAFDEEKGRPTIDLDIRKPEDCDKLLEILALTQMHINQMGIMRASLNTDKTASPFGALRTFFENEGNEDVVSIGLMGGLLIDKDDVFSNEADYFEGLNGISWAIKHGYAGTNAEYLENPIISIHELGKENVGHVEEAKKRQAKRAKKAENKEEDETKPTISATDDEQQPVVDNKPPKDAEQQSFEEELEDEELEEYINALNDVEENSNDDMLGANMISADLRTTPLSKEEKKKIEKRLRRLIGNVAIKWTEGAIETLKSGAKVAGRTAVNAMILSDRMVEGTELHEAFHRIFEILIPNSRREKMYLRYRDKYNTQFRRKHGRNLTDRDISEEFAEMFRNWMLNKPEVNLHWNLIKTFQEIKDYKDSLKALGDRGFAALFILANSGLFRFVKPNNKNVEHFMNVLGGQADLKISAKDKDGKVVRVELDKFPGFGGRSIFNDAINGIAYAILNGYSIDMLASNAAKIQTSREEIANLYKNKGEKTKHSSWFRILTGEYVTSDEKFNVYDAIMWKRLHKGSEELREIQKLAYKLFVEKNGRRPDIKNKLDNTKVDFIISKIITDRENSITEDELDQKQKILGQLFQESTWWMIEKKINAKLQSLSIDSLSRRYDDYIDELDNGPDVGEVGQTVHDHIDEFYDHSRTDDASAAIRFFLSSIPDERFATQDDVDAKIVSRTVNSDGTRVMVSNATNLLGFQQYLSMSEVSNALLMACRDVQNVQELDERLQSLKDTNPILYRIARKYHSAFLAETVKTPDGSKNRITLNGKVVDWNQYDQHIDENRQPYYVWNDAGEHPGERIEGAVTQTNPDMEAFVTQLFNYVACQKLDFIMVTLEQEKDDDGNTVNAYKAVVRSSDSDYAATLFPKTWFARLRNTAGEIFHMTPGGQYKFTKDGKQLLSNSIKTLKRIQSAFIRTTSTGKIEINGKALDKNNAADFDIIEREFITALNTIGIDVSKEALEYYLLEQFGRDKTIRLAFGLLMSTKTEKTSFGKFVEEMESFKEGLSDTGKNEILTLDVNDESMATKSKYTTKSKRSGVYIYANSAFVKWLATGVSRYNKATSEIMTNGPEGTKRYMFAQSHTASDMTDNYNKAKYENGQILGSKMLNDMKNYIYNFIEEKGRPIGSIIIKQLMSSKDKSLNLVLHTHGGVKVDTDYTGGLSYKKIVEREDWLAKAAILRDGGIIFPTLSDKSTWFYLTGAAVPGLDYKNLSKTPSQQLLHIGVLPGSSPNTTEAHLLFDFNNPCSQLDQMIEYAKCERAAIEREINRGKKNTPWALLKKLPIITFFEDNRKRFGGLSEIIVPTDDGGTRLILLNDYDKTPEKCLETADKEFFGKSLKDLRRIMALTLETGFYENLKTLERTGLISATNNLIEYQLGKNGRPTKKTRTQHRLFLFHNIGLDNTVISELKKKYLAEYPKKKNENYSSEQTMRAESQAICQYVWDIYLRGVISNEETERMYTGQPQFFKWKHDKIYDALSGRTLHVLTDRHGDQTKRLGGLGSTGERNRQDLTDLARTYRCAEVKDQNIGSKIYSGMRDMFIDNYIRLTYLQWKRAEIDNNEDLSDEERNQKLDQLNDYIYEPGEDGKRISTDKLAEEMLADAEASTAYEVALQNAEKDAASYKEDIKVADGAALITPKMAKMLLRQRGAYTEKVKNAFDILEGKVRKDGKHINPLTNADAYLIINDALFSALKYSAYGYRMDESTGDIPVHYYDKFSLQVLFPQMATGFTSDILAKMEKLGVDMLMMDDAVKTGSQEAVNCTPDMFATAEDFEKFNFNTYEQDFVFLRRQLNTDPKEKDTTQMGTLMTKIALSNLDKNRQYVTRSGKKIRGRDILKNVMTSINELSNIGYKNIEKEFFTEGRLDMEKFAAFLEDELTRRDADENLLDGIEIEEKEVDGEIVQLFKLPLEAMSSVSWIESIIVSKINREVCDINVHGNAFYQRSVWGMEGNPKVLSDELVNFKMLKLNRGKELQLINEEGSTDIVLSIDFFEHLIPNRIKGNFNASKQWLIDNGIISGYKKDGTWSNAAANMILSRIPTQGQSSIHAGRCVDVLPIVRDTVVMPKEITKKDGSDFDIDKSFITLLSYKLIESKEDGKTIHSASTEFDPDNEKEVTNWHRNNLIENYLTLLMSHGKQTEDGKIEGGDSMHVSMRSVDGDTSLWTNVMDRIREGRPKQRYYAYLFGNLAFLTKTKIAFMLGKVGIGPFALNNNNQILTMLYGVKFAKKSYPSILEQLGCLDLSKQTDKQGKSILSWLSGGININVDVAKNPERVADSNLTSFTYNTVLMLLRTGMGERALLFNMQPIMFELSRVYDEASSMFMQDISKSKSQRQKDGMFDYVLDQYTIGKTDNQRIDERKLMREYTMRTGTDEEKQNNEIFLGQVAKELFGIDENGKYKNTFTSIDPNTGVISEKEGCILEDILTNKEALKNKNGSFTLDNLDDMQALYMITVYEDGAAKQIPLSARKVQQYVYFIQNAMSPYAQAMSDLVNACKIDTKKHGKNYVEQRAYMAKYNAVFNNQSEMFEQEGLDALKGEKNTEYEGYSFIDTKTHNATDLYERILREFSIQSTQTFADAHERLLTKLNSSEENKQLSAKVTTAMMTWLKSKFFKAYIQQQPEGYFDKLFYGKESIQARLIRLLNQVKRDREDKFYKYGEHGITLGRNGVITNPLLKALLADIYEEKDGFNHPLFIKLESALIDESVKLNDLERAWYDLYMDDHYVEDEKTGKKIYYIREFAKDLAVYAFLTSGDRRGNTRFFHIVPNPIRTSLTANIGGVDMSYAQYMEDLLRSFYNAEYDISDEDLDDVIELNWKDNDFVKETRMTTWSRKYKKYISRHTSFGSVSKKDTSTRKIGKNRYTRKPITKTIHLYIAGMLNTKKGPVETIHKGSTSNLYPPFIKIRQPHSTKYDADNLLLYKLVDVQLLDSKDQDGDTFPVYKLAYPEKTELHAGSFEYTLFEFGDEINTYPKELLDVINRLKNETLTDAKTLQDVGVLIKKALQEMCVSLENEEIIEEIVEAELVERRKFDVTEDEIKTISKWIKSSLKSKEKDKPTKSKKTKSKNKKNKKSPEFNDDDLYEDYEEEETDEETSEEFNDDDVFDENDDLGETEEEQSEESDEEQGEFNEDDVFDDDFDDAAEQACTGKTKKR